MDTWVWVVIGGAVLLILTVGFTIVPRMIHQRTQANLDWLRSYVDGRIRSGKKPIDPSKF